MKFSNGSFIIQKGIVYRAKKTESTMTGPPYGPDEYPNGVLMVVEHDNLIFHWNFYIQAPVTPIWGWEQMKQYLRENGELKLPVLNSIVNAERFQFVLRHNRAGRNGEWVSWLELYELYKG